MTRDEARKKFMARLIPYGMGLMKRADAHGIEWQSIPMEQLLVHIILAEEFSTPDEYRGGADNKNQFQHS